QKSAIPLRENLSAGSIRKPAVEVVTQECHEQREAVNQAIGRGVEPTAFEGQDVGQESIHLVVGQEQASHEEEDLEEVPELRRFEQTQERRLFNFAQRLGLFEFGGLVEVGSNIQRHKHRNDAGHENDSPAIGVHCFFGRQIRNESENQRAENIAEGETGLDKAANCSAPLLRSIFDGESVTHRVFTAE